MKAEILTLKQMSEDYNIAYQKCCYAARTGALKAVKRGTKYYVSRQAANEYMGIDNNEDNLKRDLEISELKNKVKLYEQQINTLKGLLSTARSVIGLD